MQVSGHARKRMEQRAISQDEVDVVLEHPHWTSPGKKVQGRGRRVHYWARIEGRLLRVTVAIDDREVISVVAPEEEEK